MWFSWFVGPPLLSGGDWGPVISIVAVLACLGAAVALIAQARRRDRIVPSRVRQALRFDRIPPP
jgi:hypothetical protein